MDYGSSEPHPRCSALKGAVSRRKGDRSMIGDVNMNETCSSWGGVMWYDHLLLEPSDSISARGLRAQSKCETTHVPIRGSATVLSDDPHCPLVDTSCRIVT